MAKWAWSTHVVDWPDLEWPDHPLYLFKYSLMDTQGTTERTATCTAPVNIAVIKYCKGVKWEMDNIIINIEV